MREKAKPLIEATLAKSKRRVCKDCTPAEWIECYETRGKWKQCEKQTARKHS